MKKILFAILAGITLLAHAADYPSASIKLIVPFPPGGGMDVAARVLSKHLTKSLNTPVIVDNRAGGNTSIGTHYVINSPADGHTLLVASVGTLLGSTSGMTTPLYNFQKELRPVAFLAAFTPFVLVVKASPEYKNFDEFVKYSKNRKLNYGTPAVGAIHQLLGNAMRKTTNLDIQQIPYKGQTPLMQDFLGGRIDFTFATVYTMLPYLNDKRVQILSVADEHEVSLLSGVPTFKSLGYPQFTNMSEWYGIWAPINTPDYVVDLLRKEIHRLARGEMREEFLGMNFIDPHYAIPVDLQAEQTRLINRFNYLYKEYEDKK